MKQKQHPVKVAKCEVFRLIVFFTLRFSNGQFMLIPILWHTTVTTSLLKLDVYAQTQPSQFEGLTRKKNPQCLWNIRKNNCRWNFTWQLADNFEAASFLINNGMWQISPRISYKWDLNGITGNINLDDNFSVPNINSENVTNFWVSLPQVVLCHRES